MIMKLNRIKCVCVCGWVYKVTVEVSCDCFELAMGEASDAPRLNWILKPLEIKLY